MSTPRNGDGSEGFDDRPEDQRGWSEPAHLGEGSTPPPGAAPERPADRAWEPPGWSLPDAAPDRPAQPPVPPPAPQQDWEATPPPARQQGWDQPQPQPQPWDTPQAPPQEEKRGGLLGGLFGRGPRKLSEVQQAFQPKGGGAGDLAAWGQAYGWTASDGTGKEDELLVELTRSAPVRPATSEVPSNVLRGRADGLDLVAFDIVSPYGRGWVATHAVTAAPVLGQLPGFRLTPARFWRHGTGGLLQIPSGDPEFDTRWVLLAAEDSPQLRRVVEDPVVRQALLGSDDGDELWSAVGFVAAIRPDGHRPLLVEHHARILAAVTAALGAGR
ncbi:hypothetical protein SAMN05660199_03524 [Klenkia soli]|uniref:Uncharacterized protein n=1 Tax=Klenkia soli TaxID=1052260 RepID=A0A1H0RAK3_9ACTN|nr:hypothetical protein [Klenkia soli]SDP26612.1 hypothetical protein SAMN05660199_03524 [Klenkia soli]